MKQARGSLVPFLAATLLLAAARPGSAQYQMERLSRGVIAVRTSSIQVYVGWRLFGNDPAGVAFNLYRSTNGGSPVRLNGTPITATTNYVDATADLGQANAYFVRPVIGGSSRHERLLHASRRCAHPAVPARPAPDPARGHDTGSSFTYAANDAQRRRPRRRRRVRDRRSSGIPSNAKDNSQSGYTGNVYLDAYRLNGTRLLADRPRPQHPRRRPLHAVPGVRPRRRRQGRGGLQDRRRHASTATGQVIGDAAPTTATSRATSWPAPSS